MYVGISRYSVLVVTFLCGVLIVLCESSVEYKLLTDKKSWLDADRDCKSRDGSLCIVDNQRHLKMFEEQIRLEPKTPVWTAGFRQHSPWVWIEGCFSADILRGKAGLRISDNQASECASICAKATFAALQGKICYCIEDIRDLSPLDARKCDITCPGSMLEHCGGRSAVSLYSLGGVNGYKDSDDDAADAAQRTVHGESRSDWKNCVYILKHDKAVWVSTDCRKPKPFLCKIYKDDGTITEYTSPQNKEGTWTEARDMCRAEGGTLADLHANNVEAVSALPDHSEFWVGLYRNTSWAWHSRTTEESPMWCTSLSKDESGEHHLHTESCSLPHQYVCQIETEVLAAEPSSMVIYVVCGTIAWILAVVTGLLVFFMTRKRYCRRNRSGDSTELHTNYLNMEEEPGVSRPTAHHSYVNTPSESQFSASPSSSCQDTCSNSKAASTSATSLKPACANVYASVKMAASEREAAAKYDDVKGQQVTCASTFGLPSTRSSTSTEGDYDLVWDSVAFANCGPNKPVSENRVSQTSENIYTEIDKVFRNDFAEGINHIKLPSK